MEFNSSAPIYIQIMDYIKKKIVIGEISSGEKLFSVRELAFDLKVNPNTVQRSYQELEREGLVYTQRGMGTYVTEEKNMIEELRGIMARDVIRNFICEMGSLGLNEEEILTLIRNTFQEGENE